MRGRLERDELLLLAPAAALLLVVVGVPVARVVELSFMRTVWRNGMNLEWAGVAQFARLWQDGRWWLALRNTAIFTGASVVLEMGLGIGFALALDRRFRGRGLVRAVTLVPWALPTAVMALAWAWIFNDSFGIANDLLLRARLLEAPAAWLGRPGTAMAALIVADVWKTTPFVAIVVLAGLQGIPEETLEAARVDGLSALARFRRITLPLLAPSLLAAGLFRTIQAYGAFDLIYVMTGGGPGGGTETVSLYAYQNYFRYLDFGYGSAIAVQSVALIALLAVGVLRLARPRESA